MDPAGLEATKMMAWIHVEDNNLEKHGIAHCIGNFIGMFVFFLYN
jgi:hypothetical protein